MDNQSTGRSSTGTAEAEPDGSTALAGPLSGELHVLRIRVRISDVGMFHPNVLDKGILNISKEHMKSDELYEYLFPRIQHQKCTTLY